MSAEPDPVPMSASPDALDLDAIEAAASAASSGPWDYLWWEDTMGVQKGLGMHALHHDPWPGAGLFLDGPNISRGCKATAFSRADAHFIGTAREAIPALVAEVRDLRTVVLAGARWSRTCDLADPENLELLRVLAAHSSEVAALMKEADRG